MVNVEDLGYTPYKKALGEYKVLILPRGDKYSRQDFKAIKSHRGAGPRPDLRTITSAQPVNKARRMMYGIHRSRVNFSP